MIRQYRKRILSVFSVKRTQDEARQRGFTSLLACFFFFIFYPSANCAAWQDYITEVFPLLNTVFFFYRGINTVLTRECLYRTRSY